MKQLGSRIRRKREIAHLQLNDLAKMVGISSSALSQIENAKAFPSIVTLKSIANALHSSVGELIGENETLLEHPHCKAEDIAFVKKNRSGAKLYLLSHLDPIKRLEMYKVLFPEGSDANNIMSCHKGQEFIYVLDGTLSATQNGKEYRLNRGDSFFINTALECKIVAQTASEAIWTVVPD